MTSVQPSFHKQPQVALLVHANIFLLPCVASNHCVHPSHLQYSLPFHRIASVTFSALHSLFLSSTGFTERGMEE
ncbi:hypothetical protein K469DRAFT_287105 [Zopfia rhizophila CBS 207.26]|uniref:Uncharacterized protein n=1 Tax=Zopfia rhizophila CBS 207.26 TaxID=1314779 RepID=A0A6A6ENT7_9PEZI|nr:hypothetical protein K469DRAFT_287105 [Zopfia rhizophila CBS 207.26]